MFFSRKLDRKLDPLHSFLLNKLLLQIIASTKTLPSQDNSHFIKKNMKLCQVAGDDTTEIHKTYSCWQQTTVAYIRRDTGEMWY